ncbi:MAG: hypothetical protein CSA72_09900 [Rhodobacterales bacterium]|nr:MAG: hypothetical protein CSA72_09900 [Rhodobacterales bacterium]
MSQSDVMPEASPVPEVCNVTLADLGASLDAGIRDFLQAPHFGLFFSAVYVLGGFLMMWLGAGHVTWTLATSLGFPLAAPFAAVGLYEVSRRLERGEQLIFHQVLGVVWNERGRQIPWMGAIIVIYFLFWTFLAHMIFALMMGFSSLTNISDGLPALMTREGLMMIAVEMVVGGLVAALLFAMTVVSLPLLLDKEIDFITAMIKSIEVVKRNPVVMMSWAAFVAVVTIISLIPWFLGLIVTLPVLGHATWHIYRRALREPMP